MAEMADFGSFFAKISRTTLFFENQILSVSSPYGASTSCKTSKDWCEPPLNLNKETKNLEINKESKGTGDLETRKQRNIETKKPKYRETLKHRNKETKKQRIGETLSMTMRILHFQIWRPNDIQTAHFQENGCNDFDASL